MDAALRIDLPEKYRQFVYALVEGLTQEAAGEKIGVTAQAAGVLIRRPEIVSAMHFEINRRLRTEGASIGYKVLSTIAKDDTAPKGVRVDAAKTLLDRAGHVAPRGEPAKPVEKQMTDMTQNDLRDLVDKLESELANRATPVSAPNSAERPSNTVDIFE